MYKGKFDQKSRQSSADVRELVAQRNSEAAARAARSAARRGNAATRPNQAPLQQPGVRNVPQPGTPAAPASRPVPQAVPAKPQKRGPRLGGVIFYTLYFMFILAFFVATLFVLNWLKGWLADYEASQPTVKAQQVFEDRFGNPDWGQIYDDCKVEDTAYEGKDEFVAYMEERVGDAELTYLETSAGLSGNRKYIVRLGEEKIATFTLEDKNNVQSPSFDNLENLEDITKIADWQEGEIEVFFQRNEHFRIVKMNGHRALVNGVELDDSFTIQIATTKAEEYLPAGTTGTSMCTQEISGLFYLPTVTVLNEQGEEMEVTYDPDTRTFTERTSTNTISPEQEDVVTGAAQTYCLWMIKEVTDRGKVAKYFDPNSDTYSSIVRTTELWMQSHNGYEFTDVKVSDFNLYPGDLFSVRISMTLNVTRTNGTVKEYPYAQSMFFQKIEGKWLCIRATNVDITQPVGKVRLTFMVDGTQVHSDFYQTDASELTTPTISPIPEGKVFSGWVRQDTDENGVTTLTLVFLPDASGTVHLPEGNSLEPMVLHALFEDADAVSPAEAAPDTTEGGN